MIRINKWLSEMGVCSKKQADRLISKGLVKVDDRPAFLGMKVPLDAKVEVKGVAVSMRPKPVFLLYNKPVGIVCTHDVSVENNLEDAISYPQRVFAVGRLDKASEGLLLLTNQGDIVNKLMRAENKHKKNYRVWLDKPIDNVFIKKMSQGVEILNTKTLACEVKKIAENCFQIVLVQGLNRQIRRMCKALGYRVLRLQRTGIMMFDLTTLDPGHYRELTAKEQMLLLGSLKKSENHPDT